MTTDSAGVVVTSLVDIVQVKARLNIDLVDDEDDDELMLYLGSASGVLADLYGDVLPVSYTEIVEPYGDGSRVMLGRSPVLSVESVQVGWYGSPSPMVTLAPLRYRLDGGAGILYAVGLGVYSSFANMVAPFGGLGYQPQVRVSYTAGRAVVTQQVQDAVLEILRINWQPQRAGYTSGGAYNPDPDSGFTYLGYYIPNGVHERLAAGKRPRQIA